MTTSDPNAAAIIFTNVSVGGNLTISGVTVTNITRMGQRPPLWANVPRLPARFVGRDALVDELVRLLRGGARSVAVHGLPGVGKSALAVLLAHYPDLLAHFSDGVLWAGLGPTPDVMSALAAWGDDLGVNVTDKPTPELRSRAVGAAIGQQRLLLVIDDAWQSEPAELLRCGGPNCGHLLTTRDLGLARTFAGDRQWAVSVPALADDLAFSLLQDLAPEACAEGPEAAQQLAWALGGLPLALELVGGFLAAPERSLFPELGSAALSEMADPGHRLELACVRLGTLDGRQVTLQETIVLSLVPLPQKAVDAFYALGAFAPKPATFDLAAAKAVTQADAATLATLVARSQVEQVGPETLALHQVVADMARRALSTDATARHWDYYLAQVNEDREDWERIEKIYSQVQWAWQRQVVEGAGCEALLAFVAALHLYQERRGLWQDYLAWAARGLEAARAADQAGVVARLLSNIGAMYAALGDKPQALSHFDQALPLRRQVGDRAGEATTLSNIGRVYADLGDKPQALAYYDQALPLFRQVSDRTGEAITLNNIGRVYADLGGKPQALAYYDQALPLFRQADDTAGEAATLTNIGGVYAALGDKLQALAYYDQALPLFRRVGDKAGEAATLSNIGLVYATLGYKLKALTYYDRTLPLFRQVGAKAGEATTLNNIGLVYADLGEKPQALTYFEQALPLRRQVDDRWGESVTRFNMAMVYEALGDLAQAEAHLLQVVALDEASGHPHLASDRAVLARIQAERRGKAG